MSTRHILRISTVVSGFVVFYLGGALLGWIVLPMVRLVSLDSALGRRRCQRIVCWSFRWMLWYIELMGIFSPRVRTEAGERLETVDVGSPCVVVANHPCLLDIVLLMGAMEEGVVVVKPWVYFNPFIGLLAWCCGYIRGGEGLARGMSVIREATQRIEEGSTVVLFPEGTRSPKGGIHEFQRGAFRIAKRTDVPLAPFHIRCEPAVLGKGQSLAEFPTDEPVIFEAQMMWRGQPEVFVEDEQACARQLEQAYCALLDGKQLS